MRKRDILLPMAASLATLGHGTGMEHIAITQGVNYLMTYGMKVLDLRNKSRPVDGAPIPPNSSTATVGALPVQATGLDQMHVAISHRMNYLMASSKKIFESRNRSGYVNNRISRSMSVDTASTSGLIFEEFQFDPRTNGIPTKDTQASDSATVGDHHLFEDTLFDKVYFSTTSNKFLENGDMPFQLFVDEDCSSTSSKRSGSTSFSNDTSQLHDAPPVYTAEPVQGYQYGPQYTPSQFPPPLDRANTLPASFQQEPAKLPANEFIDGTGKYRTSKSLLKARQFTARWRETHHGTVGG